MAMVKIEQELPPGFTMPPEKNISGGSATTPNPSAAASNRASAVTLLGFQDLFQQSMQQVHDPSSAGCKRNRNEFSGQRPDPFPRIQRPRAELPLAPNAHGLELDWQYDFNRTIASLNAKHGAIDKDCSLSSDWMKKMNLFGIWVLLKELEKRKLDELDLCSLAPFYTIFRDAEKLNINVKWLHKRLDEIRLAIVARHEAKRLEAAKNEKLKQKKKKEDKLRRLRMQVQEMEDEVTVEDLVIEDLDGEIKEQTSKFQHFQTTPLSDGLI